MLSTRDLGLQDERGRTMTRHTSDETFHPSRERRKELRFPAVGIGLLFCPIEEKCIDKIGEELWDAACVNMSLSGLAFDVKNPLEKGQKLMVVVDSPSGGEPEKLLTEVRWCKALPNGDYRIGTAIQEVRPVDQPANEEDIQLEPVSTDHQFPSEVEFFCPSCRKKATFLYNGIQQGRWKTGMLPLYDCSKCKSTQAIISILRYNRQRFLPKSE
jgi:hypothetical protein